MTRLTANATPDAPPLVLRPWQPSDAVALLALNQDSALRRWTSLGVHDEASAARWVREQREGREAGTHLGFAVLEAQGRADDGELAGHVVLKRRAPDAPSAQVGYWTAAHARGRSVAPRALRAVTDWAFATFGGAGLECLELLHQVDNLASCRVAQKCGYAFAALLPAAPPAFPRDGHLHMRT
ncbi:GNAT family N-acetyltransferase [Streptomyces sp. R21]|uniref:GNAT family N-acetyltransferase n=1 Tax=Streptomyces sp. R21 TaxID=3238627 RepID=A0AB39PIZ9_9ACTN